MDPFYNCILEICCNPEGALDALTTFLIRQGVDANTAEPCAKVMLEHFDFAEKGTLKPLKDSIARLARGADYKG